MQRPRAADLVNQEAAKDVRIAVIGCGAIGSNAAYLLAKMGIGNLVLVDPDVVAEENLEPQIYSPGHIGREKVVALSDLLIAVVDDVKVYWHRARWERVWQDVLPCHILVSGVDSMEARMEIGQTIRDQPHYLDARMGGNIVELYHVTPDTRLTYWKEAVVQAVPLNIPCSMRSVAYNGMVAASLVCRAVAALLNGEPVPYYQKFDLLAWFYQKDSLQVHPVVR